MANIYQNAKLSLTTTADTVLYTVPANSRAIVKSILSANEKEQVITEPLVMEESEVLKVQAASGNIDVVASILEINREDR
jgi:hypothetical protein